MKDEHIITQSDKGNIYFKIICNSVGDGGENVFEDCLSSQIKQ